MSPSLQYLAGLLDGEGCIDISRQYQKGAKRSFYVNPRVRLAMANNAVVIRDHFIRQFDGRVWNRKSTSPSRSDSWQIEWITKRRVMALLTTLIPYLILKLEQAKLVIWWLENMSEKGNRRTVYSVSRMEEFQTRLIAEMKLMKRNPLLTSEESIKRILK